ncbi:Yae1 family protein [Streptomyces sp. NPDC000987]|uniref:Yae1 family protein n=1 Tax=Streptomyces sp. NPDC000987 TaxID=3154374 RepID=UPI003322BCE7
MVGSSHEAMHRIFQDHPRLFSRVSEVLGIGFAPPTSVTVLPTDVTETRPLERRLDTLLKLETQDDEPLLLAVEAQGSKDPDKPASWAYYASYLLTKYRLQPMLLVVCQDPAIAEWAACPVAFGPPQWPLLILRPLVAGPHNMPVLTDPAEVREDLALATLSAITHAKNPAIEAILKAMTVALRDEPEALANPIIELVAQGLGRNPAADIWRKLVAVDLSFYKSPLSQEIREEGRVEGRVEGREEGRQEGLVKGETRRAARDVLQVLEVRGIGIPDAVRERVLRCDDPDTLSRWLGRAVIAPTAEDIFAED